MIIGFDVTIIKKIKNRMEQKTMNKKQETQVLKGIYSKAVDTILKAVDNRHDAIYDYETYLKTVQETVQVFNADFDLERDLKLVSRGLDESVLRYVTRLDRNSQKEQLDFYRDIKNSL